MDERTRPPLPSYLVLEPLLVIICYVYLFTYFYGSVELYAST